MVATVCETDIPAELVVWSEKVPGEAIGTG